VLEFSAKGPSLDTPVTAQYSGPFAANDCSYNPPEFADPAFRRWALRVAIKVRNFPPDASDFTMCQALIREGVPSPAWVQAFEFMTQQSRTNKSTT
jgi:hypothetical protein